MGDITFINLSHPGDIQDRDVQAGIRRHVMKDIGRSRRKRKRAVVVPLQIRMQSATRNPETMEGDVLGNPLDRTILSNICLGLSLSINPCGILGVDLDSRALQIVHFSKLSNISGLAHDQTLPVSSFCVLTGNFCL